MAQAPASFFTIAFWLLVFSRLIAAVAGAVDDDTSSQGSNDIDRLMQRDVYEVEYIDDRTFQRLPNSGRWSAVMKTMLMMSGANGEAPIMIDLAKMPDTGDTSMTVRIISIGTDPDAPLMLPDPRAGITRHIASLGKTTLRNAQLVDPATGHGLLLNAWAHSPFEGSPTAMINVGAHFIRNAVELLGLRLPADVLVRYAAFDELADSVSSRVGPVRGIVHLEKTGGVGSGQSLRRLAQFDVTDAYRPINQYPDPRLPVAGPGQAAVPDLSEPGPSAITDWLDRMSSVGDPACRGRRRAVTRRCVPRSQSASEMVFARTKGVLSIVTVVAKEAVKVAGIAGMVAAPVFIILDLVHGDWVGAAVGAAGLILGVVAAAAVAGPVGFILGGLIGVLFAILPGLFKAQKPKPPIDDTTQIVQFAMFGDKDHTGNEKCRSQGNADCTAAYGPGVLSSVFKWNNFDSIAFLLHYNAGYPMTIEDIASAFHVTRPSIEGDGEDKTATIDCNLSTRQTNNWASEADEEKYCPRPTFAIKRDRILIPVVNQTADMVFDRIIPNPGGDCKLLNDAGQVLRIPDYNMTLRGQPAAIACNVTSEVAMPGTEIPLDASTPKPSGESLPAVVSSGNFSTDRQNGHYIAPPPGLGFEPALNYSNSVCLDGKGGSICLLNGTYDIQTGGLGFNSRLVNSLALPVGAMMRWTTITAVAPRQGPQIQHLNYTTNHTSSDETFSSQMRNGGNSFDVLVSEPAPSSVCLYTRPSFKGDVVCYGPGGSDLVEQVKRTARSMAIYGNATAWIYADHYGDRGGVEVTTSIADLRDTVYGNKDDFNQKIVALWVTG
ncbi:MAG: hypothetical protein M1817_000178 [Caeruleum heppii]|nr:MAG: hypothetical protein M1817_000178 [Caeruleum heppii]